MKILIISDIHGNFDALAALQETYDELWVLGDLVNYGPDPAAVIDFVRSKATVVVCGNHDYSIGFNQDPRCSARFREMAEATRRYTNSVLSFCFLPAVTMAAAAAELRKNCRLSTNPPKNRLRRTKSCARGLRFSWFGSDWTTPFLFPPCREGKAPAFLCP